MSNAQFLIFTLGLLAVLFELGRVTDVLQKIAVLLGEREHQDHDEDEE